LSGLWSRPWESPVRSAVARNAGRDVTPDGRSTWVSWLFTRRDDAAG